MSHATPNPLRRFWRRYGAGYLFASPYLLGLLVLLIGPLAFSLALSFVEWDGVGGIDRMKWVGLDNYKKAIWEYHAPRARYQVSDALGLDTQPAGPGSAIHLDTGRELMWEGQLADGDASAYLVRVLGAGEKDRLYRVSRADLGRRCRVLSDTPATRGEREFFWKPLGNSCVYAMLAVPLGLCVSLGLALLLNRNLPGIGLFRTIFYLPHVVAGVATIMMWQWVFHPDLGLINSSLRNLGVSIESHPTLGWLHSPQGAMPALILMSLWNAGGAMLIFLAALQNVPEHLYEAARVDGAGRWHQFRHVTLPQISPAVLFNLIMGIIGSLQIFTQAYMLYNNQQNNAILMYVQEIYYEAFQFWHFGYASAMAWILFVIILALTLAVVRSSRHWVYYEA